MWSRTSSTMHHSRRRRSDSTHRHTLAPGQVAFVLHTRLGRGRLPISVRSLCASLPSPSHAAQPRNDLGYQFISSPLHVRQSTETKREKSVARETPDTGTDPCHPWLAVRIVLSYNYCRAIAPLLKCPAPARYGARLVGPWSEQPRQCGEMAGQMTSLGRRIIDIGQKLTF